MSVSDAGHGQNVNIGVYMLSSHDLLAINVFIAIMQLRPIFPKDPVSYLPHFIEFERILITKLEREYYIQEF